MAYSSDGLIPLNEWSHVVAVRSGLNSSLYLNGQKVDSRSGPLLRTVLNDTQIRLGNSQDLTRNFNGYIDEVKIWDTALSESEVLTEYNLFKESAGH